MTTSQSVNYIDRKARVITIRQIEMRDIYKALRNGLLDFLENPSHYFFAVLIYPVIGLSLFFWASQGNLSYLIYPLVAGFALLGPVTAIGLYEVSRRRELGLEIRWVHWFGALQSPAILDIALLALWLLALFIGWLITAQSLYWSLFADSPPTELLALLAEVFGSARGWQLLILGHLIGFIFALTALATTVVAFPLLLDQNVGVWAAVATSVLAAWKNPLPVLGWGACVAVLLVFGSLSALVGLIVVLPVLGHATWHLYRRLVQIDAPDNGQAIDS